MDTPWTGRRWHVLAAALPPAFYGVSGDVAGFEVAWCAVAMAGVAFGMPRGIVQGAAISALAFLAVAAFRETWTTVLFAEAVVAGTALLAYALARHVHSRRETLEADALAAIDVRAAHEQALEKDRGREKRLQEVVDNLPEGVLVVGKQGQVQLVNPSATRMLGTAAPDALWRLKPEGRPSAESALPFAEVLVNGRPARGVAATLDTPTGKRLLSADLMPLGRPHAPDGAVLIVLTDVTHKREYEAELERTRRQLAHAERMNAVGSLTSGVFHEIRTPLTYITNNLNIARFRLARAVEGEADVVKAADHAIDRIAEALDGAARINRLVTDLRQFTKPAVDARVPAQLAVVLDEAVRLFRATHPGATVVETRLDADPTCVVDRVGIQQLALNLIENAHEAMGGQGKILLRLRQSGELAEFSVQDEGPGVPPELHARIFDEFYTTKPHGTGIGLHIVRRIVEAHGGSIRIEGGVGKGARFVVSLPLANAPVTRAAT